MKRIRFTEEQIIAVLREHEAGAKTADLARKHGISEATLSCHIENIKKKLGIRGTPVHFVLQLMRLKIIPCACERVAGETLKLLRAPAPADIIELMREEGFLVTQTNTLKPRKRDPRVVRHFVRMRHEQHMREINGSVPEIMVINANDGSSSLRMEAGLFRFVCSNGLIVKSQEIQ